MDVHKDAETVLSEALQNYRREQVDVGFYAGYRHNIREVPQHMYHMWDGRHGSTNITTHCVERMSADISHISSTLQRAGLRAGALEKTEINKMLWLNLIKPAKSFWPSPILSVL